MPERARSAAVTAELPEQAAPPGTAGRILHAGLELFAEKGFSGTSIRDIGARAGINSATLYSHYRSKEHVLAALVLLGHQELHVRLQRALVRAQGGPGSQLAALVRAHVLAHAEYPLLALVANAEMHALGSDAAAPALALREQSWQLLLVVLDEGIRAGEFTATDPLLAAAAIVGMGRQVAHWYGPRQPYTPEQIADTFSGYALAIAGAAQHDRETT
ncbi:TetR/AcrR family transcriptional regulator [Streptomyces maoxianensis]|uniref:TetR/AcrR family transcriptional regulator n=1 Tax=Streptomyces maoxianensis TaxID=1459942 RepID=A0ABV9G6H9_9ACTN